MKTPGQDNVTQRSFPVVFSRTEPGRQFSGCVEAVTRRAGSLMFLGFLCAALLVLVARGVAATFLVTLLAAVCSIAARKVLAPTRTLSPAKINRHLEPLNAASEEVSGETESDIVQMLEVVAINPESGVSAQELLRVAASAASLATQPAARAIVQKGLEWGMQIQEPDDFHYLAGKAIHCWIDEMPTLVGSRTFLMKMGVTIPIREGGATGEVEIFVAQGCRLLGALAISNISPQRTDCLPSRPLRSA